MNKFKHEEFDVDPENILNSTLNSGPIREIIKNGTRLDTNQIQVLRGHMKSRPQLNLHQTVNPRSNRVALSIDGRFIGKGEGNSLIRRGT